LWGDIIGDSYKMEAAIGKHLVGLAFAVHIGISTKHKGPLAVVMISPSSPLPRVFLTEEDLSAHKLMKSTTA